MTPHVKPSDHASYTPDSDRESGPSYIPRVPRWIKWLAILVPVAGALTAFYRATGNVETRTHAESVYVSKSDYTRQRERDSSMTINAIEGVHRIVSGLDSSDRCRRGQSAFCR